MTDATPLPAGGLHILVYGTPAPQGSKTFKGISQRGHAVMVESSKKVQPWRLAVADAVIKLVRCCDDDTCGQLRGGYPLDGPLRARVVFTVRKPTSAPKTRRTWPDRYPDLSKLLRSTEDAVKDAGGITDDARIVEYVRLAKAFPGEDPEALDAPGVRISIWPVTAEQPRPDYVALGEAILAAAKPYRPPTNPPPKVTPSGGDRA